jgi:Zn-dependent protease
MATTNSKSFRLFRIAGIDVYLHWFWFLVAAFEISSRTREYSSIIWNVLEYLALFLIVLLHEFGHAFACRQVGGMADKILLWPLGGVAYVSPPQRPGATLWSIAAGPLVNIVLLPVLFVLDVWCLSSGWPATSPNAYMLVRALLYMDIGLLIFNLLPIYPLDGGQILRSLLWFLIGRARSLMVVSILGFAGGIALIAGAAWLRSGWIGIISIYVFMNCWNGWRVARLLSQSEKGPLNLSQMLNTEDTEVTDPKLQQRALSRYAREMASLHALGFRHLAFSQSVFGKYSVVSKLPILLAMRSRKTVMAFASPLRFGTVHPILVHLGPSAIALCLTQGVQFYSSFSDNSLLISNNFPSVLIPSPNSQITRLSGAKPIEDAWLAHRRTVEEMEARGNPVRNRVSLFDFFEYSKREADNCQIA